MPFIQTKTTKEISPDIEALIRKELGKAIELFKGKSERWLMLEFVGGARMAFRGETEPDMALISVALFGKAAEADYDAFTKAATDIVSEALAIAPDRIYIKYQEYEHWGYGGENF